LKTIRTEKPILCYVTDRRALAVPVGGSREVALREQIRRATAGGLDWIQLREKDLDTRSLFGLAHMATEASRTSGAGTAIMINDRLDVVLAARAAGVHFGEASLPIGEVVRWKRQTEKNEFLTGVSCHSLAGALAAARDGADYIFFGPVFATPSKAAFGSPQGLARLAEVSSAVRIPVLAIGGITLENAMRCLEAGAAGIAGIRLFQDTADLGALRAAIG
jgi:thiamine-phosphate pyrophosphorylase